MPSIQLKEKYVSYEVENRNLNEQFRFIFTSKRVIA